MSINISGTHGGHLDLIDFDGESLIPNSGVAHRGAHEITLRKSDTGGKINILTFNQRQKSSIGLIKINGTISEFGYRYEITLGGDVCGLGGSILETSSVSPNTSKFPDSKTFGQITSHVEETLNGYMYLGEEPTCLDDELVSVITTLVSDFFDNIKATVKSQGDVL